MKTLAIIILALVLEACALTAVSTVSLARTGKSLTDHTATALVPNADCSTLNVVKGYYYCEIDDPASHYNRLGY